MKKILPSLFGIIICLIGAKIWDTIELDQTKAFDGVIAIILIISIWLSPILGVGASSFLFLKDKIN